MIEIMGPPPKHESKPAPVRICATHGCGTVLSRYSDGTRCSLCERQHVLKQQLIWAPFYAACAEYDIRPQDMHYAIKQGLVRRDYRGVRLEDVEMLTRLEMHRD